MFLPTGAEKNIFLLHTVSSDKMVNGDHLQKYRSCTSIKYMWISIICCMLGYWDCLSLDVLFVQRSLLGHLDFKGYCSALRNLTC